MRISVAIPCYNAGQYLGETLESILRQDRVPEEIIVADDCSTDDSVAVAQGYPGVTVVRQERNSGCAASRNLAIRHATGDVIAIVDADDVWDPHHLRVTEAALAAHPEAGYAFSQIYRFGIAEGRYDIALPRGVPLDLFDELLPGNFFPQPTVVFRRSLFDAAGGFDASLRYCEDYDLWLRFALRAKGIYTGETTAGYRMREGQLNRHHLAMFSATWAARDHALAEARTLLPPERVADIEERLGGIWEDSLHAAWAFRSREALDFLLAMAPRYPAMQGAYRTWKRRRDLWPLLAVARRAYEFLPERARHALRPNWGPQISRI